MVPYLVRNYGISTLFHLFLKTFGFWFSHPINLGVINPMSLNSTSLLISSHHYHPSSLISYPLIPHTISRKSHEFFASQRNVFLLWSFGLILLVHVGLSHTTIQLGDCIREETSQEICCFTSSWALPDRCALKSP